MHILQLIFLSLLSLCLSMAAQPGYGEELKHPPKLLATISLPAVTGRIDHLAADTEGGRLFIAALGNNTVEVVDIVNNKYLSKVDGLSEPQGIAFDEQSKQLFIAEGDGGALDIYDASSLKRIHSLKNLPDADNVRLDSKRNTVLVGYGSGAIAVFDMHTAKKSGEAKLGGHPESFRLDSATDKMYANVPDTNSVIVIDTRTLKVLSRWHPPAAANYPMALEEGRVFIACRKPAQLVVFDNADGKVLQTIPMSGDCDDLFYDREKQRLYATCGAGFLDVFEIQQNNELKLAAQIPTEPRARTSLFVPSLHRLYIAAPKHDSRAAEILVFDTQT